MTAAVPVLAEVSDKMGSIAFYIQVPLVYIAIAVCVSIPSRWILLPFIAIAGLFAFAAISEPWTDPHFWAAVRAEKGMWYFPSYAAVTSLPSVVLSWLFIHRHRGRSKVKVSVFGRVRDGDVRGI